MGRVRVWGKPWQESFAGARLKAVCPVRCGTVGAGNADTQGGRRGQPFVRACLWLSVAYIDAIAPGCLPECLACSLLVRQAALELLTPVYCYLAGARPACSYESRAVPVRRLFIQLELDMDGRESGT
jgi:hypothetical protein